MNYFVAIFLYIGSMLGLNVFSICFLMLFFFFNSYSYESIIKVLSLSLRRKISACWEATQFVFPSVLSGLDDCYYCSNIIVSLLFKLYAKFSLRLQER